MQHAAHVAHGSVCVFFGGGAGFEPQFPYHTAICSGGGGGFNLDSPTTEQFATGVVFFLRDTTSSLVLGVDRALHVRLPEYSIIVKPRNRYFYHTLRRHQSGAC